MIYIEVTWNAVAVAFLSPQAEGSIAQEPLMEVFNVASAAVEMDSLSLDANVQFMI